MTPLLKIQNLRMHFPVRGGVFRRSVATCKAVDDVSLDLMPGETVGLVGESGCGKTTMGRSVVRLYKPTSGSIQFEGTDITTMTASKLKPLRRNMQMIFQDPAESLNSRHSVREILEEPLIIHNIDHGKKRIVAVEAVLEKVGLRSDALGKYPHEFSGGQRQRIGIARALMLRPKLIICDEPVSALDVSVRSQVINLILDLQKEFGLAYLFIAHDLGIVRHVSDRIVVMYLGKIVEMGPADEVFFRPMHAYTKALLAAIPRPDPARHHNRPPALRGEVPSPINPPEGCAFGYRMQHPRWSETVANPPVLKELRPGYFVSACPCCVD